VLSVNVWKEPEISRTLPVRPDGNISLPLVGDLVASGRTPAELQNEIRQQLVTYLSDPEVAVVVQEAKSHKFNIVGEVEKPGSYVMTSPMTVLDAIALAGGLRDFARATKIYVLRVNTDGSRVRLPFNYKQVIRGNDLKADVQLEPRDTIVVP
jgi:polysaccharide export outer membrane protein